MNEWMNEYNASQKKNWNQAVAMATWRAPLLSMKLVWAAAVVASLASPICSP